MYKIYINGTPLFLVSTEEFRTLELEGSEYIKMRYNGKRKSLFNYIDLLEKNQKFDGIVLYFDKVEQLMKDFSSLYKVMRASGGVVANEKNQVLMIYRRDHWDMAKGKIEKGEKKKAAAIREVMEETGVQNIELKNRICTTYHTYFDYKDRRVLKKTYWFGMTTTDTDLTPQAEEDIEKAVFVDLKPFLEESPIIYGSILDVLDLYQQNHS